MVVGGGGAGGARTGSGTGVADGFGEGTGVGVGRGAAWAELATALMSAASSVHALREFKFLLNDGSFI